MIFADEGVPPKFCAALIRRKIQVIGFPKDWRSLSDKELLSRAKANGAMTILTRDRHVGFQNNLAKIGLSVVVIPIIRTSRLKFILEETAHACRRIAAGEVVFIAPPTEPFS